MTLARMDLTTIFEAISVRDEERIATEIAKGLRDEISPSKIAGRLGIPAALGDITGNALPTIVAAGRIGNWIRLVPPGPEPGAVQQQLVRPAIPMVAAALYAASAVTSGYGNQTLNLPDPLFPKDITHQEGAWGAIRDAYIQSDTNTVARVLMGLYGSGTDYREIQAILHFALNARFLPKALLALNKAIQLLDDVEWGTRQPTVFQWLLPHFVTNENEPTGAAQVREFIGDSTKSLDFIRTRLALSRPEAAGAELREKISTGSRTNDVLSAVMAALKNGANPPQVALQISIAAAAHLTSVPLTNETLIEAASVALRVSNAARLAVTNNQDTRVTPIIFHAANFVNQTIQQAGKLKDENEKSSNGSQYAGGLIEYGILRNIERQIESGDELGARTTVQRYLQMSFPSRSLAGILGLAAAHSSIEADHDGRGLLVAQAAGEELMAINQTTVNSDSVALANAVLHIIKTQPGDQSLAQRVKNIIDTTLE
jgi:hypothetical protein